MLLESPRGSKNPVGAITPNSFSYPIWTAEVRAALFAGAKAAAELRRAARRVNFMVANWDMLVNLTNKLFVRHIFVPSLAWL